MLRRLFISALIVGLALLGLAPKTVATAATPPIFSPPGHYYVALGDSYGFGYQDAKLKAQLPNVNPASFNTGFVDDFAGMLAMVQPGIQTVNFSCSGETSGQALSTPGCPSGLSHVSYTDSQVNAAVAFVRAHPGQVSPITVELGGDDVNYLAQSCGGFTAAAVACLQPKLPGVIAQAGTNVGQILGALRQAAPTAEIIAVGYPNPTAVDPTIREAGNSVIQSLNGAIASAAAATGAYFADVFTPFNLAPDQPATLCRLTLMCPGRDIHPSDAGYAVIAQQIWNASGYGKFGRMLVVGFDSANAGQGQVYFGAGPACAGLVEVATRDLHPGTTTHVVIITGNDLPGSVGDIGLMPGVTYWYEAVTATSTGQQVDNNGGNCYSTVLPTP